MELKKNVCVATTRAFFKISVEDWFEPDKLRTKEKKDWNWERLKAEQVWANKNYSLGVVLTD